VSIFFRAALMAPCFEGTRQPSFWTCFFFAAVASYFVLEGSGDRLTLAFRLPYVLFSRVPTPGIDRAIPSSLRTLSRIRHAPSGHHPLKASPSEQPPPDWASSSIPKILGVLRNYGGGDPPPPTPLFFLKPFTSVTTTDRHPYIDLPRHCTDVEHEVELAVVIGKGGTRIPEAEALDHIVGYAAAIDVSARCVQNEAKRRGLPWAESKGYDTFCPIGPFIPKAAVPDPQALQLVLTINGTDRQRASTGTMLMPVTRLISALSHAMSLVAGDIILTGTPAGVGPLRPGDVVGFGLANLRDSRVTVRWAL